MKSTATIEAGPYTVWEFRSVDGRQRVVSVRKSCPDDMRYTHEYQRILWRGMAASPSDAEAKACVR
jgi:hypothetical protein